MNAIALFSDSASIGPELVIVGPATGILLVGAVVGVLVGSSETIVPVMVGKATITGDATTTAAVPMGVAGIDVGCVVAVAHAVITSPADRARLTFARRMDKTDIYRVPSQGKLYALFNIDQSVFCR